MKNGNKSGKDASEYCFYLTYKPQNVKLVSKEELDLIKEHYLIISALRNTVMSVKDIHNLFRDQETGDFTYTLKTIYRHLEKLETAGIVTAAGYREKKGTRSCEKVYCRTAKIFCPEIEEEDLGWWELENGEQYAQIFRITLAELLQTSEPDKESFNKIFKQLNLQQVKARKELFEKARSNEAFADSLSHIDIDKLNSIVDLASILKILLQDPDLLKQMQNLLDMKDPKTVE
jgi:DNA-binding transcriptional ArsR family regulator